MDSDELKGQLRKLVTDGSGKEKLDVLGRAARLSSLPGRLEIALAVFAELVTAVLRCRGAVQL